MTKSFKLLAALILVLLPAMLGSCSDKKSDEPVQPAQDVAILKKFSPHSTIFAKYIMQPFNYEAINSVLSLPSPLVVNSAEEIPSIYFIKNDFDDVDFSRYSLIFNFRLTTFTTNGYEYTLTRQGNKYHWHLECKNVKPIDDSNYVIRRDVIMVEKLPADAKVEFSSNPAFLTTNHIIPD